MNEKLYIIRKEHRMKQKDVAEKIGVHPQTYHEKEKGKRDFTIREARMLAKLFNCTLDELFGEEN